MRISYRITREDYIDAQKLHRSKGRRAVVRGFVVAAKVVVVACFVLVLVLAVVTKDRNSWSNLAPLLGLGVVWALLLWVWTPFSWRRCYAKDRRWQQQFTADISEDGIHLESVDFDANLKWTIYLRFIESNKVFLLYQTGRMFNLLPKVAFAPGEIEELRELLRRKLPDK